MEEGICFDAQGRIDLKRYGYFPVSTGDAVRTPSSVQTPLSRQPGTSRHTVPSSRPAARPKQAVSPSRAASPRSPTKVESVRMLVPSHHPPIGCSPRSPATRVGHSPASGPPLHSVKAARTARPREAGTQHRMPSSRPAARPKQAVSPSRVASPRSPTKGRISPHAGAKSPSRRSAAVRAARPRHAGHTA